jgi:DUF4097 and DUF4098 domain-containing protein YvlB
MTYMNKAIVILFVSACGLLAQEGVERASVPVQDPSRPLRVHATLIMGGITVHGADVREVTVEGRAHERRSRHDSHPERSEGMKRIDLGNAGLDITEDNNVVEIKTASWFQPVEIVVTVPRRASLQLKCMNGGDIVVDHVDGEIDANNLNGAIIINDSSGAIVAHSLNGAIRATLDHVDPGKPMSFSTMNGEIDVTLPADVKANVRMKTDNGAIYSDFDVTLNRMSSPMPEESGRQSNGSYHVRFNNRAITGTINGGGPEYQFTSFNGQIYIRKRK